MKLSLIYSNFKCIKTQNSENSSEDCAVKINQLNHAKCVRLSKQLKE